MATNHNPTTNKRLVAMIAIPLIVIVLITVLFSFAQANDQRVPKTAPPEISAEQDAAAVQPTENGSSEENTSQEIIAPTPIPVAPEEIVAQVNRQVVSNDLLTLAQGSDQAVSALVGSSPSSIEAIIETLINGELVLQQARAAGFSIDQEQLTDSLNSLLASQGKSISDLELSLAAQGLTIELFEAYFDRLKTIDQFSAQQSQALGISVTEYVRNLQHEAQISFGPAVTLPTPEVNIEIVAQPDAQTVPTSAPEAEAANRGTNPGQLAPGFELPALNSPEADFLGLDQFLGKPVLPSFWTTWCPYCRAQTPVLVEAFIRYSDQIQFVGINVREEQETVQPYVSQNLIPYPILLDTSGKIADAYQVSGFPTTYLLDENGVVVTRQIGQLKPEMVEEFLGAIIASNNQE